jgi:hypothetical protein
LRVRLYKEGICSNCGEQKKLSLSYNLCFACRERYRKMVNGKEWNDRREKGMKAASRRHYIANRDKIMLLTKLRQRAKAVRARG